MWRIGPVREWPDDVVEGYGVGVCRDDSDVGGLQKGLRFISVAVRITRSIAFQPAFGSFEGCEQVIADLPDYVDQIKPVQLLRLT